MKYNINLIRGCMRLTTIVIATVALATSAFAKIGETYAQVTITRHKATPPQYGNEQRDYMAAQEQEHFFDPPEQRYANQNDRSPTDCEKAHLELVGLVFYHDGWRIDVHLRHNRAVEEIWVWLGPGAFPQSSIEPLIKAYGFDYDGEAGSGHEKCRYWRAVYYWMKAHVGYDKDRETYFTYLEIHDTSYQAYDKARLERANETFN